MTGDVWTPTGKKEGTALTASRVTLSYKKLNELLLGEDYAPGAAQQLRPEDGSAPIFIGRTFIRGQGKSEGVHQRDLPIPAKARSFFATPDGRARLATAAKRRLDGVATVHSKILKIALLALAQGGADKLRLDDRRMDSRLASFDAAVDVVFFEHLFADVDRDALDSDNAWAGLLIDLARGILREAEGSVPIPSIRRHRAVAAAWRFFEGGARKQFPDLFTTLATPNGGEPA